MQISYDNGIIISDSQNKIFLDSERSKIPMKYQNIITHAHSDHTSAMGNYSKSHLTDITLDLYKVTQKTIPNQIETHNYYECFEIGDFEIEFIKAGHLLGAIQVVVYHRDTVFLYTGDFCPEPLLTVEQADLCKKADIISLDTTYGSQTIQFDHRDETRNRIFIWIVSEIAKGNIPVIHVAHLGGAQELIKLLNSLTSNLPVFCHSKISKVNEVYQNYGVSLNYQDISEIQQNYFSSANAVILLPRSGKTIEYINKKFPQLQNKISRGIVTGQTARFGFNSFAMAAPLSTHASFGELSDFILKIRPNHVFTQFGYSEEFASYLSHQLNIPSQPIYSANNLESSLLIKSNQVNNGKKSSLDKYFS
ncbi:MAG: MBL fold metallo-hydrolase [Candidatus Heimdallarchaeota archaeon]|nr:MBL fold metallo-hydrolase [Candidatus Heimdallarchaeota archaeon]MDH5646466.1 MBL fold metallo-hydrolase [Candidatus Heimdallarchaeota archaeon]